MAKYHVSANGEPAICRAQHNCPLGGEGDHIETSDINVAREFAEKKNAEAVNNGSNVAASQTRTLKPSKKDVQSTAKTEEVKALIPRDDTPSNPNREGSPSRADYYKATDEKHFNADNTVGSTFTDPNVTNLEELTACASLQRGGLDGDDREALIAEGADPEAFAPPESGIRYLKVDVPGNLSRTPLEDLPADAKITIEDTKGDGSGSPVVETDHQPKREYGTLIIGKGPDGNDQVFTAHPGTPSRRSGKGTFDDHIGKTVSPAELAEIAGTTKVSLTTRIVEDGNSLADSTKKSSSAAEGRVNSSSNKDKKRGYSEGYQEGKKIAERSGKKQVEESKANISSTERLARKTALESVATPRIVDNVSKLSEKDKNTINERAAQEYSNRINTITDEFEKRSAQLAYDATPNGREELENEIKVEKSKRKPSKKKLQNLQERHDLAIRNKEIIASYYLRENQRHN